MRNCLSDERIGIRHSGVILGDSSEASQRDMTVSSSFVNCSDNLSLLGLLFCSFARVYHFSPLYNHTLSKL
jgi:hypothetical protein